MNPNDFGLIRQKDHTLFALLYPYVSDVSELQIEVRHISSDEWINGEIYSSAAGGTTNNPNMKRAIIDVSKYDYLLLPSSVVNGISATIYTGLSISDTDINIAYRTPLISVSHKMSSQVFYDLTNTNYKYAFVCQDINDDMPIIGIFRHRTDQVNPKGIIKDVNSDILQPVKKDKLNSEADRIRDELPGNAESPDLDSKSGSGAEPAAAAEANR